MMRISLFSLLFLALWIIGCGLTQDQSQKRDEYLYRAQGYYDSQKYLNALQQLELALEIDAESKPALIYKGWSLYNLKKYDEAEAAFQIAYALDDTDPLLNSGLGSVYYRKALLCSEQIAKIVPRLAHFEPSASKPNSAMPTQAELERRLEQEEQQKKQWLEKSLKHYKKYLEISQDNANIYKMIAIVQRTRGLEFYPNALEFIIFYLTQLDKTYEKLEKSRKATLEKQSAPDLQQKEKERLDAEMQSWKQQIAKNRQDYQEAQTWAADWLYELAGGQLRQSQEATDPQVKAKYQKQAQDYCQKAIQRLEILIKSDPESGHHYRNLAKVAILQGDFAKAIRYLQEYLEKYPLDEPKKRVEARLELEKLQRLQKL